MKKKSVLTTIISILFFCLSFGVSAKNDEVTVVIPDYQIVIDGSAVYYADSLYPFLNYKGITYLPMTYQYARAMNLTTGYIKNSVFLVAFQPCDDELPLYETTVNQKNNTAIIPTGYAVCINAKKVNNEAAEYPLLNFRDVTYFPLTWEYAVEEFGWGLYFDGNTLSINTEKNTAKRWSLVEKRENDAVLLMNDNWEIPLDNGSFKTEFIAEYYSLDYKTGTVTRLYEYTPSEKRQINYQKIDVCVKDDGYVYYNTQKLEELYIEQAKAGYVKPDDVESTEYSVSASMSDVNVPLNEVKISLYTANHGKEASWGRMETYTFLKVGDALLPVGLHTNIENVYELGEDIYFNTIEYVKTISSHPRRNRKMWKLSVDGELTEIHYGMFNSLIILGKANDKLYLKCLWSPENSMHYAPYSVNLRDDGYYTWDGQGIRFNSPYVYSDFDILSDNGEIFAVNNVLDKITKCEVNQPERYWD